MSWPTPGCNKLIDAITVAEGGPAAFILAVRCSIPDCADLIQARQIAANTIAHKLWDHYMEHEELGPYQPGIEEFIAYFASRPDPAHPGKNTGWAPIGAENDPKNLNQYWTPNVLAALRAKGGIA